MRHSSFSINLLAGLALLSLLGSPDSALGGPISWSGDVVVLDTPPASVDKGDLQSGPFRGSAYPDFTAFYFDELVCVHLVEDLTVSIVESGFYETQDQLPDIFPTILAGNAVNSHFLHFDPRIDPVVEGSVTFDTEVLGVIFDAHGSKPERDLLGASDALLGAPGTLYPSNRTQRKLEIGRLRPRKDAVGISEDRRTVSFRMRAGIGSFDQLRIVTKAVKPVPEPASIVLFVAGLGVLAARGALRRRE